MMLCGVSGHYQLGCPDYAASWQIQKWANTEQSIGEAEVSQMMTGY